MTNNEALLLAQAAQGARRLAIAVDKVKDPWREIVEDDCSSDDPDVQLLLKPARIERGHYFASESAIQRFPEGAAFLFAASKLRDVPAALRAWQLATRGLWRIDRTYLADELRDCADELEEAAHRARASHSAPTRAAFPKTRSAEGSLTTGALVVLKVLSDGTRRLAAEVATVLGREDENHTRKVLRELSDQGLVEIGKSGGSKIMAKGLEALAKAATAKT